MFFPFVRNCIRKCAFAPKSLEKKVTAVWSLEKVHFLPPPSTSPASGEAPRSGSFLWARQEG